MRVAFINTLINPFRIPLMREVAAMEGLDITVFHSSSSVYRFWEKGEAGFPYKVLPGYQLIIKDINGRGKLYFDPTLLLELFKGKYDVIVVFTWSQPGSVLAQIISKLTGIPVLLWDDTFRTGVNRSLLPVLGKFIRSYSGYLVGSTRCADYYASYGVDRSKMFLFPNVIDNARFSAKLDQSEKRALRIQLGLPESGKVVLYCGQLVHRKGVMELLEAWKAVCDKGQRDNSYLVFVGKGDLQNDMCEYIQRHDLMSSILLPGFCQYDELPQWYAVSDLFVLLSNYDAFPFVINEALSAGLPVIATETVGAVGDLVKDGVTGLVVPPKDVAAVADALVQLLHDDDKRHSMSERARQIMQIWNSDLALSGLRKAIEFVTQESNK